VAAANFLLLRSASTPNHRARRESSARQPTCAWPDGIYRDPLSSKHRDGRNHLHSAHVSLALALHVIILTSIVHQTRPMNSRPSGGHEPTTRIFVYHVAFVLLLWNRRNNTLMDLDIHSPLACILAFVVIKTVSIAFPYERPTKKNAPPLSWTFSHQPGPPHAHMATR
jgi:hypothetical protein